MPSKGLLARRQYRQLRWAVNVVGERYSAVRRGREVRRAQGKARWAVGVIGEHYLAWRIRVVRLVYRVTCYT